MVENSVGFRQFIDIFNTLDKSKVGQLQSFMDSFAINFNLFKDGSFFGTFFPF